MFAKASSSSAKCPPSVLNIHAEQLKMRAQGREKHKRKGNSKSKAKQKSKKQEQKAKEVEKEGTRGSRRGESDKGGLKYVVLTASFGGWAAWCCCHYGLTHLHACVCQVPGVPLMVIIKEGPPGELEITPEQLMEMYWEYGLDHVQTHVDLSYSAGTFNAIKLLYTKQARSMKRKVEPWNRSELREAIIDSLSSGERAKRRLHSISEA